jgi:hypothetical protein
VPYAMDDEVWRMSLAMARMPARSGWKRHGLVHLSMEKKQPMVRGATLAAAWRAGGGAVSGGLTDLLLFPVGRPTLACHVTFPHVCEYQTDASAWANENALSSQRGRKSAAFRGSTHHSERRAVRGTGVARSCLAAIGATAVAWRDAGSSLGAELAGGILAACALSDGSQPVAIRLCQGAAILVPRSLLLCCELQCSTWAAPRSQVNRAQQAGRMLHWTDARRDGPADVARLPVES